MRVISGKARGRKLKFPKLASNERLRPLTGRAKEALFNILVNKIEGARFLDLFAGTGSVGIEALSRGASLAFFVEINRKIAGVLRENLELTGFSDRSEVYNLDVLKAIKIINKAGGKFDIIFIGAPYGSDLVGESMKGLSCTDLLALRGVLVAEHSVKDKVMDSYGKLCRFRDERYGDTQFSFYSLGEVK